MAAMNDKIKLSQQEIDEIVIAQADDDNAWEEPIEVKVAVPETMTLPPKLAARAAFFAQLHNMDSAEAWLQQIIQERIAFEEAAFTGLKRVMEKRPDYDA
jgi:hypothetical protein